MGVDGEEGREGKRVCAVCVCVLSLSLCVCGGGAADTKGADDRPTPLSDLCCIIILYYIILYYIILYITYYIYCTVLYYEIKTKCIM